MNDYNESAKYQRSENAQRQCADASAGIIANGVLGAPNVRPHSDELGEAIDKLDFCVDRMERFFQRFYGNDSGENAEPGSYYGFIGSIERATKIAARLALICDRLDQIA